MKIAAILCLLAACAFGQSATEKTSSPVPAAANPASTLSAIKRVYVDALTGDDSAAAIRELLIASLQQSRLFVLTDNPDRADATLKGAANDTVFTDTFDSQEGLNARANSGSYKGTSTRSSGYGGLPLERMSPIMLRSASMKHLPPCGSAVATETCCGPRLRKAAARSFMAPALMLPRK